VSQTKIVQMTKLREITNLLKCQYCIVVLFVVLQSFDVVGQNSFIRSLETKEIYEKEQNLENLENLVNEYLIDSKYTEAEKAILSYLRSSFSTKSTYKIFLLLARVYRYQKKKDLAMIYFLRANSLVKNVSSPVKKLEYGVELIEFYRKFVEFDAALIEIEKLARLIKNEKVDNALWLGRYYNRSAAVMNEIGENSKAFDLSHAALFYSKKAEDLYSVATSYNELGFTHKNLNNLDSTLYYYNLSEALYDKLNCHREVIHVILNRLEFMNHTGIYNIHEETIKILNEALAIIERENLDFSKASIYERIENNYFFLGEYQLAHEYAIKVRHHSSLENKVELEKSFQNIKEKFENDKLKLENTTVQSKAKFEEEKRIAAQEKLFFIILLLILIAILSVILYVLWFKLRIQNRELLLKNKQKTFLIQEIHHRVKNNLQFVRSILKMQKRLKTVNAEESLADISRRIDAMSLVHEMLYTDGDAMTVSAKEYFERLMDVSESFYNQNNKMHISLDIAPVDFPLEKLIALGLICSELLANSVKHVFDKVENPHFKIRLEETDSGHLLHVQDNGTEMSEIKEEERVKLGMRLIDIFSRQVNGTYDIRQEKGYAFEMVFP